MTNPQKRAADPSWATSSTLKVLRAIRPSVTGPVPIREVHSHSQSQPARTPVGQSQQPRQDSTHTPSGAQQAKPVYGKGSSSTFVPRSEPRLPVSQHSAPAPSPRSNQCQVLPGNPNPSIHTGSSHPPAQPHSPVEPAPWIKPYKPAVRHAPHPRSQLCQNFHWVPYPLGLLPYDSWFKLHHRPEHTTNVSAVCPACLTARTLTPHARKVFLVAERLSWEDGLVSIHDKRLNEELNWAVNYELGILDPFVEDPEQVAGGKNSRTNRFYPYQNEYEMKLALKYIFMAENITEITWALWIGTQLDLEKMLGEDVKQPPPAPPKPQEIALPTPKTPTRPKTPEIELIDLTYSPERPPRSTAIDKGPVFGIPTPPSSFRKAGGPSRNHGRQFGSLTDEVSFTRPQSDPPYFDQSRRIVSYKTLQDFYSLLDKIERTSYVGATFLEAYAEKLRDDLCKACWLKHNVRLDLY